MNFRFSLLIILFAFTTTACSIIEPYKFDITQGNDINDEKLEQVKKGMTESQVIYLIGNPSIKNSLSENRWDYVVYVTDPKDKVTHRLITILFDGGIVTDIQEKINKKPS